MELDMERDYISFGHKTVGGFIVVTWLLLIIYLSFIGLGLPDAILGASWAIVHRELGVDIDWQGILTITISGGTIVSSFLSGYLIKKFKTGPLTFISTLMTAIAVLGMTVTHSFFWFWFFAIPLGLGAGAVDTALNNYVALHYQSRHMNWLHSFWGVGALTGPFIISFFLNGPSTWRKGYLTIALCLFFLTVLLFLSLPIWKRVEERANVLKPAAETKPASASPFRLNRKILSALLVFLFYSATEMSMNAWGSVYLINTHQFTASQAARTVSLFFIGIMTGRFLVGFISSRLGNPLLIRIGQILAFIGAGTILLAGAREAVIVGFLLIGLGCAPIFPAMIHETPNRFGSAYSQRLIGFQMGFSYIGGTFIPPLIGIVAKWTTFRFLPHILIAFILIMFICSEALDRIGKTLDN